MLIARKAIRNPYPRRALRHLRPPEQPGSERPVPVLARPVVAGRGRHRRHRVWRADRRAVLVGEPRVALAARPRYQADARSVRRKSDAPDGGGLPGRTKVQYRSSTASSRFKVLAVRRLPRRKRHELRNDRSHGRRLAMMGAAFVGAFILVVVQRKLLNLETAATR